MASGINVMLMTFILLSFTGFKFLFLSGQEVNTEECSAGAIGLSNCFIGISSSCPESAGLFDENTVCLNFGEFPELSCSGFTDCIEFIGKVIIEAFKILLGLIFAAFAFIINIFILIALYLTVGLTPLPQAPFVINFIVIGPFILGNIVMILGFLKGD